MNAIERYEFLKKEITRLNKLIKELTEKRDNLDAEFDQFTEYLRDHGDADEWERE